MCSCANFPDCPQESIEKLREDLKNEGFSTFYLEVDTDGARLSSPDTFENVKNFV